MKYFNRANNGSMLFREKKFPISQDGGPDGRRPYVAAGMLVAIGAILVPSTGLAIQTFGTITVRGTGCSGTIIGDYCVGSGVVETMMGGGNDGGGRGYIPDHGGSGGSGGTSDTKVSDDVVEEDCNPKAKATAKEITSRPVIIPSGNKVLPEIDFSVPPGGVRLEVVRLYDKALTRNGIFGPRWGSSLEATLSFDHGGTQCHGRLDAITPCSSTDPLTQIYANGSSGFASAFTRGDDGVWRNSKGSTIVANGSGWQLVASNGDHQTYDSNGRPLTVFDERGVGLTYSYNGSNQLATITHASGRAIQITWSGSKVSAIVAPNGKAYGYGYNGSGYLASVVYPDNLGTKTYHYENGSQPGGLTGISINGVRYSRYAYQSDGRVAWSGLEGAIDRSTFAYGADYTNVTNALGQTTKYVLVTSMAANAL